MDTVNRDFTSVNEKDDRYARHRLIAWWDQQRVTNARVLVAGAGAIGNEVVKLLALMGVNNLLIVDFDRIDITNLTRSVLFRDTDVGKSKAAVAAIRARELNPESVAVGIEGDLEFDVGLGVYRKVDVVIGCLDSINARLALNRASLRAGTPWLNGGIEATFGEVSLHSGSSACFECGMTESMWDRRNMRFSCGGQRSYAPTDSVPTTATMASIIAAYLVNEALLLIHADSLQSKEGLRPGQRIIISLMPYDFQLVDLTRNPDCSAHDEWSPICELAVGPDNITPYELIKLTGNPESVVEIGFDLLTGMTCVECGATQDIMLPIEKSDASLTVCPACGKETRRPSSVSWTDARSPLAHTPMSALCIAQQQVVAVSGPSGRIYYQLGPTNERNHTTPDDPSSGSRKATGNTQYGQ